MRKSEVTRKTNETDITVRVNLDGTGVCSVKTGIGFFDHMLEQVARHGLVDLDIEVKGDLHIDPHHTVEDTGIALGQAFSEALGEARGIRRYGFALLPMDEALAEAAIDVSGRPHFVYRAELPKVRLGEYDAELTEEFFRAFAMNARLTLHLSIRYFSNAHHGVEILFKAFARALRMALEDDPRVEGVPSTKGMLDT